MSNMHRISMHVNNDTNRQKIKLTAVKRRSSVGLVCGQRMGRRREVIMIPSHESHSKPSLGLHGLLSFLKQQFMLLRCGDYVANASFSSSFPSWKHKRNRGMGWVTQQQERTVLSFLRFLCIYPGVSTSPSGKIIFLQGSHPLKEKDGSLYGKELRLGFLIFLVT